MLLPHQPDPQAFAAQIGVPFEPWMKKLEKLQVNNGALIAMDYQTGETLAYVGSAGYYRDDISSPQFQPQFDVLGDGWRQPGSAFKPFNYVTGINNGTMTAASMFMDVTTTFDNSGGYTPKDWDLLERGPVRMRTALQWSLNIPAVKALVDQRRRQRLRQAQKFGMTFQTDTPPAGLSLTLGTEVTTRATWPWLRRRWPTRARTSATPRSSHPGLDRQGSRAAVRAARRHSRGQPAGGVRHDQHPGLEHRSQAEPDLGRLRGPGAGRHAPAGDAQDRHDPGRQRPRRVRLPAAANDAGRAAGEYALVVGVWNGNSRRLARARRRRTRSSQRTWPRRCGRASLQEVSSELAGQRLPAPGRHRRGRRRRLERRQPTQFTTQTYHEVFISGTVPGDGHDQGRHARSCPIRQRQRAELVRRCGSTAAPARRRRSAFWPGQRRGRPSRLARRERRLDRARQCRAPGTPGGPDPDVKTKTSFIFNPRYTPFGKSWGAPFAPTTTCVPGPAVAIAGAFARGRRRSLEPSLEPTPDDGDALRHRSLPRHRLNRHRPRSHRLEPPTPKPTHDRAASHRRPSHRRTTYRGSTRAPGSHRRRVTAGKRFAALLTLALTLYVYCYV